MAEPADMLIPMLREMREENRSLHGAAAERLELVGRRLQALTSDTLISRLLTGESEERIEALEKKVKELEAHR